MGIEAYKHIITPLQDEDIEDHPNAEFLRHLKQTCRPLIIDGPNCVIGCLPDKTASSWSRTARNCGPGWSAAGPDCSPFLLRSAGWTPPFRDRDKSQDFQPMHLDTAIVGPDRQEVRHMPPNRPITPSTLSVKDLPWQILWDKETCTLCGSCTAVCPVNAIELGVFRKRLIEPPVGLP